MCLFVRCFVIEMLDYVERRLFPNVKPIESTMSLTKKDFKLAGEIMAMSILQGGQAPNVITSQILVIRGKKCKQMQSSY